MLFTGKNFLLLIEKRVLISYGGFEPNVIKGLIIETNHHCRATNTPRYNSKTPLVIALWQFR